MVEFLPLILFIAFWLFFKSKIEAKNREKRANRLARKLERQAKRQEQQQHAAPKKQPWVTPSDNHKNYAAQDPINLNLNTLLNQTMQKAKEANTKWQQESHKRDHVHSDNDYSQKEYGGQDFADNPPAIFSFFKDDGTVKRTKKMPRGTVTRREF